MASATGAVRASILGVGAHLPPEIRDNDYWAPEVVAGWRGKTVRRVVEPGAGRDVTPAQAKILAAIAEYREDPFHGSVSRRVLSPDRAPSDMELDAAVEALERSGVDPAEVDLLMVYTLVPDKLAVPNAFKLHRRLGLRRDCIVLGVDGTCNTFLGQLELAAQMIGGGVSRTALLVQSCVNSRITPPDQPYSAWFGDAASAVVVGRAQEDDGILGSAHVTDSAMYHSFACTVSDGQWYDDGPTQLLLEDAEVTRSIMLNSGDGMGEVARIALGRAGLTAGDVDYFGAHAATVWSPDVLRDILGIPQARAFNTYPLVTNVGAANIPLALYFGERESLLRESDVVLMCGGGAGGSWSAAVARWSSRASRAVSSARVRADSTAELPA